MAKLPIPIDLNGQEEPSVRAGCRSNPVCLNSLDDALQEIRAHLGFAPTRLYETGRRAIRFGPRNPKQGPGWAFVRRVGVEGVWAVNYGDWRTGKKYTWYSRG